MYNKDNFTKAEIKGRDRLMTFYKKVLKDFGYSQIGFTSDRYERYDAIIVNKESKKIILVEVKNRSEQYLSYKDVFAEKDKIIAISDLKTSLLLKNPDYTIQIMYFNSYDFSNKIRFVFYNEDSEYYIKKKWCNKTTVVKSEKVLKDCMIFTKYTEIKLSNETPNRFIH